jgi:NAD(P)-dependent dehydrogenase (short-subunit alcohol dehydrogenase family)
MSKTKFHSKSTALEVIADHDLTGYEVIVTGGNSGIGVETIRAFAKANARVILAARNLESAKLVANEINMYVGKSNVEVELLDLASLKSVRDFVKRFEAKKRHLNILINNAGKKKIIYFKIKMLNFKIFKGFFLKRNYGLSS